MTSQDDLKELMRDNYIKYASYVILERAIPDIVDGLKPVQRRILHTLKRMDDGRMHKVANVTGQTMAFHPHGDAPINDALINLANKDFLLDRQGNFGNLHTGDPAAAARYIETRLSPLARETLFNSELTTFTPSYDGRAKEPVVLPAKVPVLLMQGAEGIAVGMSTRILPHNFSELIEAEIDILEGKEILLLPDFPTGGIMDASAYDRGHGKVRLRAAITIKDEKTITINEVCHSTTTESVTRSIDEAAKRGKIKIDSIADYTAEKVEIEIKLPRGQYAEDMIESLYAFTDCEVSLNSIPLVIKDDMPWEAGVDEILRFHVEKLKGYLQKELELERDHLLEKIFQKTLEQIFIENRLYKKIEEVKTADAIDLTVEKSLVPFHEMLSREPTKEDRERLLQIPIRRISRFDIDKNQEEIAAMEARIEEITKDLKSIKRVTIRYLKALHKKYAKDYPRRTRMKEMEVLDLKAIKTKKMTLGFDAEKGFLGSKISGDKKIECTNYDKILILYDDGTFKVINIPEKQFIQKDGALVNYVGIADKETIFRAVYRDKETDYCFIKRFIVTSWMLDKEYDYLPEESQLELLTNQNDVEVTFHFKPKARQKQKSVTMALDEVTQKGVKAKGIRVANKAIKRVKVGNGSNNTKQLTLW